jgi:hypothetical protein
VDLYCGLGGWADGFLAEGYEVIGFDIERHDYRTDGYPGDLVLQDVRTLHGSQFKDAAVIVASPPCQEYSYMAMPWSRGKKIAEEYRAGVRDVKKLTELFDACFRIAREAQVPLIVENVRGAIPWVGQSRWHYGSFHLWGDVPALMPISGNGRYDGIKSPGIDWSKYGQADYKAQGFNVRNEQRFREGIKGLPYRPTGHWTNANENGTKQGGDSFNAEQPSMSRLYGSKSDSRKAASVLIAKIPFPLARHIARCFQPVEVECGV